MWLNIRGCSGAGKSYVGFKLFEEFGPGAEIRMYDHYYRKPKKDGTMRALPKEPKLIGHLLPGGLCLAGRYVMKKSTVKDDVGYTGGLDGWHPMNAISKQMEDFYDLFPHGYFESLMISGTFERWHHFAEGKYIADDYHGQKNHSFRAEGPPRDVVFATLSTPLDVCLAGIQVRNDGTPVEEDKIREHRKRVLIAATKFAAAGDASVYIDRDWSYQQVLGLLQQGGWNPKADSDPPSGCILVE